MRLARDDLRRTVRVLVTGATGFTGGHLARTLAAQGYAVRALVRDAAPRAADLASAGIAILPGDLRDPAALAAACSGVDVVYHVAAVYRQAGIPRETYRAVNAYAVRDVIEAAARNGVRRVVHCSTVGVHGDVERPPAGEDAPLRPGDVYQETKLEGERLAREAAGRLGIDVTIVRPTGIYGPGDRRLLKLFGGVARRRWITLGTGEIYYHLTYIDDLVEGFRLCGEHAGAANRTYILAGGEVTTLNELVAVIAAVAGVPAPRRHLPVWPFRAAAALCEAACAPFGLEPPLHQRRVDFFTKSRAFDTSRARQEIGYTPRVSLRDGIARTLNWYREQGWL
jgi:dihydroflavonol-4-reductase